MARMFPDLRIRRHVCAESSAIQGHHPSARYSPRSQFRIWWKLVFNTWENALLVIFARFIVMGSFCLEDGGTNDGSENRPVEVLGYLGHSRQFYAHKLLFLPEAILCNRIPYGVA